MCPSFLSLNTLPQVSCDFEDVKTKYFPDFDIKAELEKGLMSSEQDSPKRKHGLKKYVAQNIFYSFSEDFTKTFNGDSFGI